MGCVFAQKVLMCLFLYIRGSLYEEETERDELLCLLAIQSQIDRLYPLAECLLMRGKIYKALIDCSNPDV